MQLKRERSGNGSFLMILAKISKYPDCYSIVKMLPEILCHFGESKHERQIKTNAKSQTQGRKFQPCIRVHRFHSCCKERHCKDEEGKTRQREQEKEQQPFKGSIFTFPYKLKILFQIITIQTRKVIWQHTQYGPLRSIHIQYTT